MRSALLALGIGIICATSAHAGQFSDLIAASFVATNPNPAPTPPSPSTICENCGGTGKLGDGTVSVTCPVCLGTGKATNAEASSAPSGQATPAEGQAAGVLTEDELPPGQQPTPMAVIGDAMRLLNPSGKPYVSVGCGFDCRDGITAKRDFGAASVLAIERDPVVANSARAYVQHSGLSGIDVVTADAVIIKPPAGWVGYSFLFGEDLAPLASLIRTADRFVTYAHPVPGLPMRRVGDLYVYERPAPRAVLEVFRDVQPARPVAYWNGRQATPKPGCNCAMCRSLRSQLASYRPETEASGHWETRRVKVCRGGICRYENQQVWIQE